MTKDEYGDFVLRYKGCGACFPMYHTLSRFEKKWFTAIQKDVAELEKENAELKKKNLDIQDAVTMQMYTNKANKEIADRQLTKAKEIIRKLIEAIHIWDCKNLEQVEAEAEQFLGEVEK